MTSTFLAVLFRLARLGKDSRKKSCSSFGLCPNEGGGWGQGPTQIIIFMVVIVVVIINVVIVVIIFIIIVIIFMIVNVGQKEKCGDDSFHCTVSGACVQVNSTISTSISSSINHFDHLSQFGCWRFQILISNFLILKIIIITNDQNHVPLKKITFRRKSYAIMPMIVVTLVMRWRNSILCYELYWK